MWIERARKKSLFIKALLGLKGQVLLVQGARQVGKTSFILEAFEGLKDHPQLKLNLLYPTSFRLNGVDYLGRDFCGSSPTGEEFLKNIERTFGPFDHLTKPLLIFIDETDQYPLILESIQTLASFSDQLKFVLTGSHLQNILLKNAATGRKKYFDLYPITFEEFLLAKGESPLISYFREISPKDKTLSEFYHRQLKDLFETYIRLGGLPRVLSAFLDPHSESQPISEMMKDLAISIEENVKSILGEKWKLYEYEDVLRKLTLLSLNTLKLTHLQVQHASRSEAQKLISKTVVAHVIHKIRLWSAESDLSKYILFDTGLANYLMNGSDLLQSSISPQNKSILYETAVGHQLITQLISRDDLYYWKSGNRAEVEFMIQSPFRIGIDVKSTRGDLKSLNSFALMEPEAKCVVKVSRDNFSWEKNYMAKLPHANRQQQISLLEIPHYLTPRLMEFLHPFYFQATFPVVGR